MKSTVDLIKAGIAEAESELKEIDKKRDAIVLRIKEMRHDMVLLSGGVHTTEAQAPPVKGAKAPPKGALKDKGETIGTVKDGEGNNIPVYKNVRTEILSVITKRPAGEWFKASIIHPAVSQFYGKYPGMHTRVYLHFLQHLKFVEHNGRTSSASRWKWIPRFQDKPMTEEEVRKQIEEDRKALQDVMG